MPTVDGARSKRPERLKLWILGSWVLVASTLALALDLSLLDRAEEAELGGRSIAATQVDLAFPAENPIWFPAIVDATTGSDPECPSGCKFGFADTAVGDDTDVEPTPPLPVSDLAQHLSDCSRQVENKIEGRVSYPDFLALPLAQESTYEATLDIRPGAVTQPSFSGDAASSDVEVGCGVGARLDGQGESIAVEDEGEWIYRQFSTPGVFQWTWNIRSTRPQDAKIRLELRPAVPVSGGGYVVPANDVPGVQTTGFTTAVHVQAGLVDEASFWTTNTWPKILAIAAVAGAALLGLIAWLEKARASLPGRQVTGRGPEADDLDDVSVTTAARPSVSQSPPGECPRAAPSRGRKRRSKR